MQKVRFLDILVIFKLDLGQITFNPVENALLCNTTAFLSCHEHRVLVHRESGMHRNQNFGIVFGGESDLRL